MNMSLQQASRLRRDGVSETIETDICVIGAGSGGLTVAAGAAQMGARVVLIEKGKMGGDCLNYGCVPSKALIAAAHAAASARKGAAFGIDAEPHVHFRKVHDHVHAVITEIAPADSVERFEGLGVRVIKAEARFTGPRDVEAGGFRVRARRFVVAAGSEPARPPINGLAACSYLTNETIFDLQERPDHLIVIGGGPIGCELAQAYRRLGAAATILERRTIMPRDDPEAVAVLRRRLVAEGVDLRENVTIEAVREEAGRSVVTIADSAGNTRITGSHVLVAAGRKSKVDGLGLEAAGIAYTPEGITVDARLRTTNKKVFAIGDVVGSYPFTHMAGYHGGIVIRNVVFNISAKVEEHAVPWVTYTDPELAHVGMNEVSARERHGDVIKVLRWTFAENDRAHIERETDGLIKAVIGPRGRILGATIVGARAGEMIAMWVLAISSGLKISALANMIVPYPTRNEISKRAAGSYYTEALFSRRVRRLVSWLQLLP
jgi:pyruvate/2-oxoglutarate dehydrogenase complex dihydrolipoamide dehydrogenase (E3) component